MFFLAGTIRRGMIPATLPLFRIPTQLTEMKLTTRFSRLLPTMLCALALIFSAATASAVFGTLKLPKNKTASVNGVGKADQSEIKEGDVIRTGSTAVKILLEDGGVVIIYGNSEARIYKDGDTVVIACTEGHFKYYPAHKSSEVPAEVDDNSRTPLGNNAAVGSGNFAFPSIGGGSAANTRLPITNAQGKVLGYAITDGSGTIVGFQNALGQTLAVTNPNGTPVSFIFGLGATF